MINKNSKKPFLKWAGNKFRIIDRIKEQLPNGKRLIEPFCGSAALFLNTNFDNYIIADNNKDLINLYQLLQQEGDSFIDYCAPFFSEKNNTAEVYYQNRETFNQTDDSRLKAALFIYLNKHGYNGLSRYNQSGGFNVPFGRYKQTNLPIMEMQYFIKKSCNATFLHQSFEATMENSEKGDVLYCDPPYVPLNATNSSFQYDKNGFNQNAQIELAKQAEHLSQRGVPVLISNHDTDFTQAIYKSAKINNFLVQRNISCQVNNRQKAQEILALFK